MTNRIDDLIEIHKRSHGKLSDKWDLYLEIYSQLLSKYRDQPIDLLEIGVQNGGSLETWSAFFTNARNLVGCDIDKECGKLRFNDSRIHIVTGDATDSATTQEIAAITDRLDIVIEDGSHTSTDIVRSFVEFFPKIRPGGIYISEDLHCCYWKEWGGGLCRPDSGMEFFKAICDCLNSNHWHRQDISADEYINSICNIHGCSIGPDILQSILSIEFYDSMCAVRKASSGALSRIKERVLGGCDELVAKGHRDLGRSMPICLQSNNRPRSLLEATSECNRLATELKALSLELEKTNAELKALSLELEKTNAELSNARNSLSWRLTKPIRLAQRILSRFAQKSACRTRKN